MTNSWDEEWPEAPAGGGSQSEEWPTQPATAVQQQEQWPEARTEVVAQQEQWPEPNRNVAAPTAPTGPNLKEFRRRQKKVKIIVVIVILSIIVIAIVGIIFIAGYNTGLKQDVIKKQFPAALNVELAKAAGFDGNDIQNSYYFYFDTKIEEDTGLFQTPMYSGSDDGAIILTENVQTTRDAASLDAAASEMAQKFREGILNIQSIMHMKTGGGRKTVYDSEGYPETVDTSYTIKTDLNEELPTKQADGSYLYKAELIIWTEGAGGGWRMIAISISAQFIPVSGSGDQIIVVIAHGANSKDADAAFSTAMESEVYTDLFNNQVPTTVIKSKVSNYDTYSGTSIAKDSGDPTKKVVGGTIYQWVLKDLSDTQAEGSDPGTYGYFVSFEHEKKYHRRSGIYIGGHRTGGGYGGGK